MRRIRAAIAVGLTWAVAWFGVGMILLLIVGVGAADVPFPLFFGLLGFLAGAAFSGISGCLPAVAPSNRCRCRASRSEVAWAES